MTPNVMPMTAPVLVMLMDLKCVVLVSYLWLSVCFYLAGDGVLRSEMNMNSRIHHRTSQTPRLYRPPPKNNRTKTVQRDTQASMSTTKLLCHRVPFMLCSCSRTKTTLRQGHYGHQSGTSKAIVGPEPCYKTKRITIMMSSEGLCWPGTTARTTGLQLDCTFSPMQTRTKS